MGGASSFLPLTLTAVAAVEGERMGELRPGWIPFLAQGKAPSHESAELARNLIS